MGRGGRWAWLSRLAVGLMVVQLVLPGLVAPETAAADGNIVSALGHHFVAADGKPQFVMGVNYVGHPDRSWTMWEDGRFDAAVIGDDLTRAAMAGASVVRIFVRSPLQHEIAAGRWNKVDTVVALAKERGLRVLVTFHDYSETDLSKAANTIRAVASRYASEGTLFGYDLQNEPHFSDLLAAQYLERSSALLTDTLVKAYGERASQAQVNAWRLTDQGRALLPARFTDREAYFGANAYRLYQELVAAAGDWVVAHDYALSTLDYLSSPDAARWGPLFGVLDTTLAAWLRPQLAALRSVDPTHLVTVGYSDQVLAGLSANNTLGFVSLHRFPNPGAKALHALLAALRALQGRFPDKPVVLEEFGYPTASRDPALTALDEAATALYAWSANMGGVLKWSLNDVAQGSNPREQSFGLYAVDDSTKPAAQTLKILADYFKSSRPVASVFQLADEGSSLRFSYEAGDALIVGGKQWQDSRLSFSGTAPTLVATHWTDRNRVIVAAAPAGTVKFNVKALLGDAGARPGEGFAMDGGRAAVATIQGDTLSFAAQPGKTYALPISRTALDAKLEIVWPQGNRPVAEAERANVGAYVFAQGSQTACASGGVVPRLWRSLNNGVEEPVGMGSPRQTSVGGLTFPTWDFNNVDVAAARNATNKYYFRLSLDGRDSRSNVWSHAADSRTYFPNPDVPAAVAAGMPDAVDAKIEVVWPHGNLPVDQAERVNIVAYVFQHGAGTAVPVDWDGTVRLWRSLNNGLGEEVATGRRAAKTAGKLTFSQWQFDNIDVSAARDPLNKYYFRLTVDGVPAFSNVWSHGKDGRTYFPKMDVPAGNASCG